MPVRFIRSSLLILVAIALIYPTFYCNKQQTWQNVYDTGVHYVGMATCRSCHEEVYKTFSQTGMGRSFGLATKEKSAADFTPEHALVYDSVLNYYYKPFWQNDSLHIMEFRLEHGDTVHKLVHTINYIVGSGQHTNSHIFNVNGYLYQAPITFYTQKHKWDLAPGFEKGANSRFGRMIELECMSCHNGYPQFNAESENKFSQVQLGIDCERCHGPGSLHVTEKLAGHIVDTSKTPDYTIVNPRRLSTELQNNVCQRCHLQGIAVLNDNKSFFDFRPGMRLSEVMNVFMPEYEGARDKMIMASHVERMKKSNCYIQSGKMSCITCHNPHVSVKFTPRSQYINACSGCHAGADQKHCTEKEAVRQAQGNDCVTCHMPHNSSIDIPHVAVTDHYIRRRPLSDTQASKITAFFGLQCFNNDHPNAITKARAYIEFHERYAPTGALLDSALFYLDQDKSKEAGALQNKDLIRVYFLMNDPAKVTALASGLQPENLSDAWTAYRIGESYTRLGKNDAALAWFARAVSLWKYSLDFENKYGTCLLSLGKTDEALKVFRFILDENPDNISANTNLGFICMHSGDMNTARNYQLAAATLDPDNRQNLINMAVWSYTMNRYDDARKAIEHLLHKYPNDEQAQAMLQDLNAKH